jgi:deoxycytidylate deaminase
MLKPKDFAKDPERTELVIGLVVPLGSDLTALNAELDDSFAKAGYTVDRIKMSAILEDAATTGIEIDTSSYYRRMKTIMDAGDSIRTRHARSDALALMAAALISKMREAGKTKIETVHLLESLKRPEEVRRLRSIYGAGFFLLGVYSSEEKRRQYLEMNKGMRREEVEELTERDQRSANPFGQRTHDTFELADAFIDLDEPEEAKYGLWRIVELLFGDPFATPTLDEHAMFLAYASSFRSSNLSRQVGAAIASREGNIIATGTNEVPKAGGGQYTTSLSMTQENHRDFEEGYDSNARERSKIVDRLEEVFRDKLAGNADSKELRKILTEVLEDPVASLTEFGRSVHAEMEAILSCARTGISTVGATLYTTTFPCHNCTKHIVDAGIERVVYVEPYPKSKALKLHSDSIVVGSRKIEDATHVVFEPFVGVAARRYLDLFSIKLGEGEPQNRKQPNGDRVNWQLSTAQPRLRMSSQSYLEKEQEGLALLKVA